MNGSPATCRPRTAGVRPAHAAASALLLAALIAPGFGDALFSGGSAAGASVARIAAGIALSTLPMAAAAAWVAIDCRRACVSPGWFRREDFPRQILRGAAHVIPVAIASALASCASNAISVLSTGMELPAQNASAILLDANLPSAARFTMAACAVAVAPLAEEIFFRGIVFRGLENVSSFPFAAFVSSFLFAAAHRNASAFASLFIFGLVQACLCRRSGSLTAPVALHALYNLLGVALLYIVSGLDGACGFN